MTDEVFEWDADRAAANYGKHGISFDTAKSVFKDAFAVERFDDRADYAEERFVIIGIAEGLILSVVYTEREGRIRLISARRATRHEQDDYFKQNADPADET